MEKSAVPLSQITFGRSPVDDVQELSSEIDAVWRRREIDRKRQEMRIVPDSRKTFMTAEQAEIGKTYTICVEEDGGDRYVKAEFLTRGQWNFSHLIFFRRTLKGGKSLVHGIADYSLIKETYVEPPERE